MRLYRRSATSGGEFAFRWEDGLLLRYDLEDLVLAAAHLVDELADEGLVVFLADRLIALREVLALLQLQPFERGDQLVGVGAALKLGFLHADLERVHRLEIGLHVAV